MPWAWLISGASMQARRIFVFAAVGVGDADGVAVVHGRYPPPVTRCLRRGAGRMCCCAAA